MGGLEVSSNQVKSTFFPQTLCTKRVSPCAVLLKHSFLCEKYYTCTRNFKTVNCTIIGGPVFIL
jgi:hypothetical protein